MADKTLLHPVEKWLAETLGVWEEGAHGGHAEWHEIFGPGMLTGSENVHFTHVTMAVVATVLVCLACLAARGSLTRSREEAIAPDEGITFRNLIESIMDFGLDTMSQIMGRENAKSYFPLIIGLSLFILFSNLLGLIPGFVPPTQNLNTSLAMGISIFVCYNMIGVFKHGLGYFKEFVGPVWWLFFLMIPIEAVGHIFRPISLAVRLTGNMGGDHTVLVAFGSLSEQFFGAPIGLPIPFFFLGLIVSIVQALVFALLSVAYIGLAVEEEH